MKRFKKNTKKIFKSLINNYQNMDKFLLLLIVTLTIFGLIMIYSSSNVAAVLQYHEPSYYYFKRQLLWVILSFGVFFILVNFVDKKWWYKGSIILLIGITIMMIVQRSSGVEVNNAKSWYSVTESTNIQLSEFAKPMIILFLAGYYSKHKKFKKWYEVFIPLVPVIVICYLVYKEPDLGSACLIAIIVMLICFVLPLKDKRINILKGVLVVGIITGTIGLYAAQSYLNVDSTTSMQAGRLVFTDPCSRYSDNKGSGYQVCNGYIAIHNGGLFGVGLGNSTQKYLYLPEAYTDFIFPIIVEEFGLIGAIVVFILFFLLLLCILNIALGAKTMESSIIAFGTFAYILTHIFVNIGGVLALIPLTGVPLPFLSYGGSFLLNLYILLALTEKISIENKLLQKESRGD